MWSIAPVPASSCSLRGSAEVLLLDLARALRARPDVHHVDVADVHPVHREAEIRMRPGLHAEHARVPVARRVDVVGGDQEMLDVRKRHALIYRRGRRRRCTSRMASGSRPPGHARMMATAIAGAKEAGIAVTVAIVDAGGHLLLLERMEGGRFHTVHSATTKAVCAASNKRATGFQGRGRASRSTLRMPSASRSPRARSAGPRWKAARRSWSTASASAASAWPAATGSSTSASRGSARQSVS